jgi:PX domain
MNQADPVPDYEYKPVVDGAESQSQILSDLNKMKLQDGASSGLENVFEQEDPKSAQFRVYNPAKVGSHIKYTVSGVDSEGPFEESRRFSEFFALKEAFATRWLGVYIPAIPEKKLMGNKDEKFVEERRALLERFMKEVAKHDYLTQSREFKIFARDKGDIEKILTSMLKQTPIQVLDKYRQNFNINENQDVSDLA